MIYRKIDENGYFIEDVVADKEITDKYHLTTAPAQGYYRPKWNGNKWIEGAAAEEIEVINTPQGEPPPETEEQKENRLLRAQVVALADQSEMLEGVLQELILETMA